MKFRFLIAFTIVTFSSFSQNAGVQYLLQNQWEPCKKTMPDSNLAKYRVFFTGEYHAIPGNSQVSNAMANYLYKYHHLRRVVMEFPYSYEGCINAYILRGNIDSLNLVQSEGKFSKSFLRELENLKEINLQAKSDSDKIYAYCIDVEAEFVIPFKILKGYFLNGNPNDSITKLKFKSITEFQEVNKDSLNEKCKKIALFFYADFKRNAKDYKLALGNNFERCSLILESMQMADHCVECGYEAATPERRIKDSLWVNKREAFMYNNYVRLLKLYPNDAFFGQFGKAHCHLDGMVVDNYDSEWNSLAWRLNNYKKSPANGLVCSIDIVNNTRIADVLLNANLSYNDTDKKALKTKAKITLYCLKSNNSPFLGEAKEHQYLIRYNWHGKDCEYHN